MGLSFPSRTASLIHKFLAGRPSARPKRRKLISLRRTCAKKSMWAIAKLIHRDDKVMQNYFLAPISYLNMPGRGLLPKKTEMKTITLIRHACFGEDSLSQLLLSLKFPVFKSTVFACCTLLATFPINSWNPHRIWPEETKLIFFSGARKTWNIRQNNGIEL